MSERPGERVVVDKNGGTRPVCYSCTLPPDAAICECFGLEIRLVEAAKVADAGTAEERYTASLDEQTSEGVAPDGFKQMDDQPVVPQVGVSGDADQAYCDWLEQQCGGVLIKRIGE